ncbi:MAG: hypothetical protein Q8P72_01545, partial [Candidatus Roizmanbacteria bacterium]|nr:hypothetical protein [Candidatus Roizmanbacteria bacterium]
MKQRLTICISFLICIGIISFFSPYLLAQTPSVTEAPSSSQKSDLESKIQELEKKLTEVKSQKNTLSAQISYMDTQMHLAELRINETEEKIVNSEKEINVLGVRISSLDNSLDTLSKQLLERIVAGYKNRDVTLVDLVLDSKNTSKLVNRLKYYDLARSRNQKSLLQVQEAKSNFIEQKDLREKKVEQLDELQTTLKQQQVALDQQKDQKQKILADTQNSESVYQNLLQQAKAEYAAIQNIVAGAGTEEKLRDVSKGETIASIIPTASCNSSGPHLHFITQENGTVANPFNYLKNIDNTNCSGSSCGSGDGDPFSPNGSWDWPLSAPIKMVQGYGSTWAVRNTWVGRIYNFHNGLDISSSSSKNVSAVADGTLYKGSYRGSNGCALSYVKLQ